MTDIAEMKRQGLSIQRISQLTGFDRKTIRKYLLALPATAPAYGPRQAGTRKPGKLDPFKEYLSDRLKAGVWNARVLLREIRERGYTGGYTILTDWLRPQRQAANTVAVRRFETPPGEQAQVDWGHLGTIDIDGREQRLWVFTMTLGYSRLLMAEVATDQQLGTLLRLHEAAFRVFDGVPREILYDRMRTVWQGTDDRGEIVWNPVFIDFARYWGFAPRLCRPYRAQTKGKVESSVKYIRRNFLCGLQGLVIGGLEDLNARLRTWIAAVANRRIHGTTQEAVMARAEVDRAALMRIRTRHRTYPYADEQLRKVARDAFVSWQASRYSVPWSYAGKEVLVRPVGEGWLEVRHQDRTIARHPVAAARHGVVLDPAHHAGIPLGARSPSSKTLVHIREMAPMVEARSLAAYEQAAALSEGQAR